MRLESSLSPPPALVAAAAKAEAVLSECERLERELHRAHAYRNEAAAAINAAAEKLGAAELAEALARGEAKVKAEAAVQEARGELEDAHHKHEKFGRIAAHLPVPIENAENDLTSADAVLAEAMTPFRAEIFAAFEAEFFAALKPVVALLRQAETLNRVLGLGFMLTGVRMPNPCRPGGFALLETNVWLGDDGEPAMETGEAVAQLTQIGALRQRLRRHIDRVSESRMIAAASAPRARRPDDLLRRVINPSPRDPKLAPIEPVRAPETPKDPRGAAVVTDRIAAMERRPDPPGSSLYRMTMGDQP